MKIGLIRRLGRVNSYSQKRCKRLFWRVKAVAKRAVKNVVKQRQQQFKFQYDPSSYALNFDDGCCHLGSGSGVGGGGSGLRYGNNLDGKDIVCVYIFWVEY